MSGLDLLLIAVLLIHGACIGALAAAVLRTEKGRP